MLGQQKLLQRLGPGPDPRAHLLGLPRPVPDDRDGAPRRGRRDWTLPWLGHQGWFVFLVDLFCVLVLVGVASAFLIRKVQRPERFKGSHLGEADLILGLIALIVPTLLLWHASLIALGLNEWPAGWSPVSNAIAKVFGRRGVARGARADLRLGARAYDRRLSSSTCRTRSTSTSRPPGSTSGSAARARAAGSSRSTSRSRTRRRCGSAPGHVADMTWKQMIDTMSCTECGRCQDVCPA